MIGSSKNKRVNYPRKCFWTQEIDTRVKRYSAFEQLGPEDFGLEYGIIMKNWSLLPWMIRIPVNLVNLG